MIYSLVLTCRAPDVEPYAWLHHILTELPSRPPDADIEDLVTELYPSGLRPAPLGVAQAAAASSRALAQFQGRSSDSLEAG